MSENAKDIGAASVTDVVREITQKLVIRRDQVLVLTRREGDCAMLQVNVADTDLGRVLGSKGETARALRRIANAIAGKYKLRCDLNITTYAKQEKGRHDGNKAQSANL